MTKQAHSFRIPASTIIVTLGLTYAWFNLVVLVPFSEKLWTYCNDLLANNNPGSASDLEFLIVLAGSALCAYGVVRTAQFAFRHIRKS